MNFYDLLKARAEVSGDKIFLRVDDKNFSFKDFLNAVDNPQGGDDFFCQAVNFFAAQKFNRSNIFRVVTSGSTAAPKILFRTYESWADFFPTQNKIFKVDETSRVFMHGSLNFTGNLNTFLAVLCAGGSIITTENFSPKTRLESATNIYLVPTKLILLAKGAPLDNVRSIFTGSQILTESQSAALLKKFPAAEIFLYYGASELSFVTYKKISIDNAGDVRNLGKPFEGVKIFIRDGLVYVDTPFRAENIPNPATVGDRGFINERGELIFEGRGENFIAYVVGNVDKKIIRQALTPAESPKEIIFIKSLPLNSAGKIDKTNLQHGRQN